jgi:hypothetical protein
MRGHSYVDFRMHTQYGNDAAHVTARRRADDVVAYLGWCREWNAMLRREHRMSAHRNDATGGRPGDRHRPATPTKRTDSVPATAAHDGDGH